MDNRRGAGLLILEIAAMLLVFSLGAAVCLRAFGAAAKARDDARVRNAAMEAAVMAAETFRATGDADSVAKCLNIPSVDGKLCYETSDFTLRFSFSGGEMQVQAYEEDACILSFRVGGAL